MILRAMKRELAETIADLRRMGKDPDTILERANLGRGAAPAPTEYGRVDRLDD